MTRLPTLQASSDYSPIVLELFERRPHAGRMAPTLGVFTGRVGESVSGADVQFWLKCAAQRIQATSFLAYGCPHTIAAASWWAQRVRGLQLSDAERVDWREAESALTIPDEKRGRLLLVQDAMRAAVKAAAAA